MPPSSKSPGAFALLRDRGEQLSRTVRSPSTLPALCPCSTGIHSSRERRCFPDLGHHFVLAAAPTCFFQMPSFLLALTYTLNQNILTEVSFFFPFVSLGTFSHYQALAMQSKIRSGLLPNLVPWLVSRPRSFGAQGPVVGGTMEGAARFWWDISCTILSGNEG